MIPRGLPRVLSAPLPAAAPPRRILIIDDHSFFSACLRALIEREIPQATCAWAGSGAQAAEHIPEFRPDLLVLDLSMGSVNGCALAETLRTQGVTTPILFASSGRRLPRRVLRRLRSAAFISKAASPRRLVSRIRQLLKLGVAPNPVALDPAAG